MKDRSGRVATWGPLAARSPSSWAKQQVERDCWSKGQAEGSEKRPLDPLMPRAG